MGKSAGGEMHHTYSGFRHRQVNSSPRWKSHFRDSSVGRTPSYHSRFA